VGILNRKNRRNPGGPSATPGGFPMPVSAKISMPPVRRMTRRRVLGSRVPGSFHLPTGSLFRFRNFRSPEMAILDLLVSKCSKKQPAIG
jgi:hypothetical protein